MSGPPAEQLQIYQCEPIIIKGGVANGPRFVGTHLSVAEHQRRTVLNYSHLLDLAADLDIVPMVQGTTPDEYERCRDLFWRLLRIDRLRASGLHRLHLFGFKTLGLVQHRHLLTSKDSSDSLGWSDTARKLQRPALPECLRTGRHKNCANCRSR